MIDKQLALVLTLYQDRLYEALNKIKKENPEMLEIRKSCIKPQCYTGALLNTTAPFTATVEKHGYVESLIRLKYLVSIIRESTYYPDNTNRGSSNLDSGLRIKAYAYRSGYRRDTFPKFLGL